MITKEDIFDIEKAKAYLDGLLEYGKTTGDDDWFVFCFLQSLVNFKTSMNNKYPDAHHYGNKYMKEKLGIKNGK